MKLFLDDVRLPEDCAKYMHLRIGKENPIYLEDWKTVRTFGAFITEVNEHGTEITHISFDHDLADEHYNPDTWNEKHDYKEETGYDCAKYVKEWFDCRNLQLPVIFIHSMNPVGTMKILNLFK